MTSLLAWADECSMKFLANLTRRLIPAPCFLCGAATMDETGLCARCLAAWVPVADVPRCPQCAIAVAQNGLLCPECARKPPNFDRTVTGLDFNPATRHLIHQLKFARQPWVLPALLRPLIAQIEQAYPAPRYDWPEVLIPMPIHPQRRQIRGFNQARLIADQLGKTFALPVLGRAVVRIKASPPQSGLDAAARRKSLAQAFEVRQSLPAHVAIVDDVMTTGSSAESLALALKQSGVLRVTVWVLARTPRP
jgi:ComF family protein